ncbi:MAG: ATP-binding protein [Methanobacterium sp.]
MEKSGQIVGGGLKEIFIREKSDSQMELGDLLVAESNNDYTILQVKDIEYRSHVPQSTLELAAGMNLEGFGDNLEFMQPELRNYKISKAKSLVHVSKINNEFYAKNPKILPTFFNSIRSIEARDFEFLKPENIDNSLYLGYVRSGSSFLEDVKVHIDVKDALTHHILIPATTGRGKSNLVKVMLWSLMDAEDVGILVLDPHDEYYGRGNSEGLKDHPKSDDKLKYCSLNPKGTKGSSLMLHIKSIHPSHFDGIASFTDAQHEAILKFYNIYGERWIEKLLTTDPNTFPDIHDKTIRVLQRKFDNLLKIYCDDNKNLQHRGSKNIFQFEGSGQSHLDKITDFLKEGKIVIVDTSKLNDYEELLVGSIIAGSLFNDYKKFGSAELKNEPVISIVIEEAPRVLGSDVLKNRGDNIYSTIAREGRKFNIGLIAITQLASLIPKTVLANMNTKIILGNEMSVERRSIIDSASQDLSDDDRIIASMDKGEAIVSSIFTKFAIPIKIPYFNDHIKKTKKNNFNNNTTGTSNF